MADGILPIARYFVRESVGNISQPPGIPPKSRKKSTLCGSALPPSRETVIYLLVNARGPAGPWPASRHWASGHMMLTGHATAVASWVTRELALDEFFAEVLPD